MHKKITFIVLAVAIAVSIWFYGHSDLKLKKVLTNSEWQSTAVVFSDRWNRDDEFTDKAIVTSIYRYLPNGTYLKQSTIEFPQTNDIDDHTNEHADEHEEEIMELNISESGQWQLSDHYLVITPDEFKDTSMESLMDDLNNQQQIEKVKQYFKLNTQLNRKIDHLDKNTLFMSDLDHGSVLLNVINNS